MKILYTNRLVLRPLKKADIGILHSELLADLEVTKHLFLGKPMSFQECEFFIQKNFTVNDEAIGFSVLCERKSGKVIGFAGILSCNYFGKAEFEFGFALSKNSWGKGYGTEIGIREVEYGFEYLKCDRLLALTHPENLSSRNVIQKIGLKLLTEINTSERGSRLVFSIARDDCHLINSIIL